MPLPALPHFKERTALQMGLPPWVPGLLTTQDKMFLPLARNLRVFLCGWECSLLQNIQMKHKSPPNCPLWTKLSSQSFFSPPIKGCFSQLECKQSKPLKLLSFLLSATVCIAFSQNCNLFPSEFVRNLLFDNVNNLPG